MGGSEPMTSTLQRRRGKEWIIPGQSKANVISGVIGAECSPLAQLGGWRWLVTLNIINRSGIWFVPNHRPLRGNLPPLQDALFQAFEFQSRPSWLDSPDLFPGSSNEQELFVCLKAEQKLTVFQGETVERTPSLLHYILWFYSNYTAVYGVITYYILWLNISFDTRHHGPEF